jgi:hypothetical protein
LVDKILGFSRKAIPLLNREQRLAKFGQEDKMEIVVVGAALIGSVFASLALAKVALVGVFAAIHRNRR